MKINTVERAQYSRWATPELVLQSSQTYFKNQYCAISSLIFVTCSCIQFVKWYSMNCKNDKNEKMVDSYNATFISNIEVNHK